jgi:peptide/nickel transport system substrate-binding protein
LASSIAYKSIRAAPLVAAAVMLGGAGGIGGCGRVENPPDVFVTAQSLDDIVSLDPAEGFELSSLQTFTAVYQRLIQPNRDQPARLDPALAARWISGERTLTFELRANAVFSSGNAVRPEDVIYSLSRAVKLNRAPAFILNQLGWTPANIDASLTKVDAHRLQIHWTAELGTAVVLNILTSPVASIVDERVVAAHEERSDGGNRWLQNHSAGSGPFKIRRYIPREALILDANPSSPAGAPRLRTLILKNVPDAGTRRLLVEIGDADMARDLGPDQIAALAASPSVKVLEFPSATIHYLLFNTSNRGNPALANPALWEAARWLIDYRGIAEKLLRGQFEVHQAFLADGFPGALDETPYYLDVARAKQILAHAGLADGVRLQLSVFNQPPYGDIAQSLQATFAQAGISLEILPAEASEVYSRVRARSEEAVWLYWIPDYFDAHSTTGAFAFDPEDGTKTLAWRAGWHIPGLSALTRAAALEPDPERRLSRYREIQSEVQKSSPYVIALQARNAVVVRNSVRGYFQGVDADMAYYDRVTK